MVRKRSTPAGVAGKLGQAEMLTGQGRAMAEAIRRLASRSRPAIVGKPSMPARNWTRCAG